MVCGYRAQIKCGRKSSITLLECFGGDMDHWLPFEVFTPIGSFSDSMTTVEVLGDNIYSRRINQQLEQLIFSKMRSWY